MNQDNQLNSNVSTFNYLSPINTNSTSRIKTVKTIWSEEK